MHRVFELQERKGKKSSHSYACQRSGFIFDGRTREDDRVEIHVLKTYSGTHLKSGN